MRRTFALLIGLLITTPGLAWNKPGHMTVASVAYQDLVRSGDQEVIRKTVALFKAHPYYTNHWLVKVQSQAGPGQTGRRESSCAGWLSPRRSVAVPVSLNRKCGCASLLFITIN